MTDAQNAEYESGGLQSDVSRPEASRREALKDPDSLLQAQFFFDVERDETIFVQQLSQNCTASWGVYSATGGWIDEISKQQKDSRMAAGGRYINLTDVSDSVRSFEETRGICPSCKREESTDDPERDMTLFVSPDRTEGWAECDQGRGHRHAITEVLLRVEQ